MLGSSLVQVLAALATPAAAEELARFDRVGGGGGLVLKHTAVHATVEAGLAVVDVTQEFENPFETPIDATYLFPLPPDAAVQQMAMRCGTRRIVAEILTRDAAREVYDAAARDGRRAALLEQENTHLFRQSVASLCPGETVTVELRYLDPLVQEDGAYALSFPTTVGPLYRPEGTPQPPLTTSPAHTVDVVVTVAEGMSLESLWSDTHEIEVTEESTEATTIHNAEGDDQPNKDFHLAWTLADGGPRVAVRALPPLDGEDGYVAVTIEPGVLEDLVEPRGRELVFVLDESCSMSGAPFETARATVRLALDELRPDDRFDLVRFSSEASALFPEPRPATAANRAAAEEWLQTFDGQGTEMTRGIVKALDLPGDPERLRLVLFMTDGYIGDDREVLRTVQDHLGEARLFSLGIGASVNHGLLDGLAEVGRGDVTYQLPETPVQETVDTFYDRIAHPALTDLELDWGDLDVTEVYPRRIPDLFAGQPVRVVARFRGEAPDTTLTLTGQDGTASYELHRSLVMSDAASHPALPALWARRKIADLERSALLSGDDVQAEVTATALRHHVVSRWTSLVATEKVRSSCGPGAVSVDVPSMIPQGVDVGGLLATSGAGMGGGGTALGLGGLGLRGLGTGSSGYGVGGGSFGHKGEAGVGAVDGDPIILGSLDKSLIEEVIRRNLNPIRYCFQRELTKDPTLGGKLVVRFVIGADGAVTTAEIKSTTMASAAVEQCIVARFRRMSFPAPQGGGVVVVSYPFVFAPG